MKLQTFFSDVSYQVNNTVGVAPLVIVPRNNFNHVVANNHCGQSVDCGGSWVTIVVAGYKRHLRCSSRMPLRGPSEASFRAAFTSSTVTLTFNSATKISYGYVRCRNTHSHTVQFAFKLRQEQGPIAFAAPVEEGMMFSAAARARRRSLCGTSSTDWSFVYE